MRSLEIRTQRVLTNLIKQNQKVDSDSVLKPSSETVRSFLKQWNSEAMLWNSVQCPEPTVQSVASKV